MDDPVTNHADRSRLRAEDGVTLVEVIVSMMLVGLIAVSFLGFDVVGRTSADQRRVAQATQVAQADQERLRGMSADQLATLSQTRTVTLDNVAYTVTSTGKYQNANSNGDSCASSASAADYAKVISSVTWTANKRSPVVETSLITPRVGGSLVVQAQDQGAAALPGVTVTATGSDADTNGVTRTGTTDSTGCVIFGSLPVGSYSVASSLSGYLNTSGATPTTSSVTTTAGTTTNITVRLGQPGKITATFQGVIGATIYAGSSSSMSWINSNMATAGILDPGTDNNTSLATGQTLFPYIIGTTGTNFTGNYTVYGGNCTTAQPPVANQSTATVSPASNAAVNVKEPVLKVVATFTAASSGTGPVVVPSHVKLTDSCSDSWFPTVAAASNATTGVLAQPGQPYGANYTVCVDYKFTGTSTTTATNFKKKTGTVSNTSFTAANGVQIDMNGSTGTGFC
jgi:Carboxypeptidase regulatory-like domain